MDLQLFSLDRAPKSLPIWPLILDDLGRPSAKRLARTLGVSERTVRRWEADGSAPKAVCLALFWLTRWGRDQVACDANNDATLFSQLAGELKRERDYLAGRIRQLSADRDAWHQRLLHIVRQLPDQEPVRQALRSLQGGPSQGGSAASPAGSEVSKLRLPEGVTRHLPLRGASDEVGGDASGVQKFALPERVTRPSRTKGPRLSTTAVVDGKVVNRVPLSKSGPAVVPSIGLAASSVGRGKAASPRPHTQGPAGAPTGTAVFASLVHGIAGSGLGERAGSLPDLSADEPASQVDALPAVQGQKDKAPAFGLYWGQTPSPPPQHGPGRRRKPPERPYGGTGARPTKDAS